MAIVAEYTRHCESDIDLVFRVTGAVTKKSIKMVIDILKYENEMPGTTKKEIKQNKKTISSLKKLRKKTTE